ncbi:probable inactive receptor kinase RLK902 [Salvia hispanica]|uniref:probable inactive receptor kinase RLK902 n=1 Tax=Salvia hispanica TaxID=49212 RepID=UPI0020090687|nr:probable inactive receptor kinase RLK902 [Salvia hispanica]
MNSSTPENLCRRFSLPELNLATGDFSEEHVIGNGGFSKVYKGFIDNDSIVVAIKRRLTSDPSQGQTEFTAEIETLKDDSWGNIVGGSTTKDENEVEVDKLSKAIFATAIIEDDVPFVLFGVLKNGEDVTIERLHYMPKHEFRAKDSKSLSWVKHENVVKLVVYNLDGFEQVLAYDFAPRGSLYDILHQQQDIGTCSKRYPALTWSQRIEIALGSQGLCYIHSNGLIHHNIRSRNILVCDDETAKIFILVYGLYATVWIILL